MKSIMNIPTCRNVLIAGGFRSFGSTAVSCYIPVFFQKIYPNYTSEYSIVSAIGLLVFGFSSVLLGGMIVDKYSAKHHMTNALICMYGALITIPLIAIGTVFHQSFWLSALLSFLSILFSGSYFSPTITMMQNSTDRENSGNVVSIYTFVTAIAQTLAPLIFNFLANFFGAHQ